MSKICQGCQKQGTGFCPHPNYECKNGCAQWVCTFLKDGECNIRDAPQGFHGCLGRDKCNGWRKILEDESAMAAMALVERYGGLKDSLLSARNMIDLTILAVQNNSWDIIPTGLEAAYEKLQDMVYDYCVVDDEDDEGD